jgi:hypothetical protein
MTSHYAGNKILYSLAIGISRLPHLINKRHKHAEQFEGGTDTCTPSIYTFIKIDVIVYHI